MALTVEPDEAPQPRYPCGLGGDCPAWAVTFLCPRYFDGRPMDPDHTLRYAQDLANLRGEGRVLRRRIEQHIGLPSVVVIADDEPMMRSLLMATLSPAYT